MTQLSKESLPTGTSKFVRDGGVIELNDPLFSHSEIAKKAALGLGTGGYILGSEIMQVDDAGEVEEHDGVLCFFGKSSSCELREDPVEARAKTVKVATTVTGKSAKAMESVGRRRSG